MSDKPKRRWYQFSLKGLLTIVTLTAIGSAWWKHRSVCLKQVRVHAERNAAAAKKMSPFGTKPAATIRFPAGYMSDFSERVEGGGTGDYSYSMQSSPTSSGYNRWFITVESGELPDAKKRIQTELDHEAKLADQYSHAIWHPWERLWIREG